MSWAESLSEKERQIGDGIVRNGIRTYEAAAQRLSKSKDPAKLSGQMAGMLINTMRKDAAKGGKQLPGNAVKYAAKTIIEDYVEIAHKTGALQANSQEELDTAITEAFTTGINTFLAGNPRKRAQ